MKKIDIQEIIDMNYRILALLGYATAIIHNHQKLEAYHDDIDACKWFFHAVKAVVYENKPLPPMP